MDQVADGQRSTLGDITTRRRLAARAVHPDRLCGKYGEWIREWADLEMKFINRAFDMYAERVDWINQIMKQFWPNFISFLQFTLDDITTRNGT